MLFPVFLAILIFLFGSKVIYAAENTEKEADRVQEALFEEFDFSKLDQEMKTLFPDEKLSFREILMQLISENGGSTAGTVVQFIKETVFYQFGTNKKILVYMILIAVAAALFNNFTSVFQNRQVSEVSFYILYMLLMTLSLVTFQHTLQDTEQMLSHLFSRAGDPGTSDADCACICYDTGSFQSDGRGSAVRICGSDQKRNCLVSEDIAGRCGRDQCASGTSCTCH